MKTFDAIRSGDTKVNEAQMHYNAARKWVFDRLEKTDHTHDRMKKDFHKQFGKHNAKHFDRAVSEYMD